MEENNLSIKIPDGKRIKEVSLQNNKLVVSFYESEFLDGDILTVGNYIFITKGGQTKFNNYYVLYDSSDKTLHYNSSVVFNKDIYPVKFATEVQKQELFSALDLEDKSWNGESKVVENIGRVKGKLYYYFDSSLEICSAIEMGTSFDVLHYNIGNYFRHEEKATIALDRIKTVLSDFKHCKD